MRALRAGKAERDYLPWDKLRFKPPPEGLDRRQWWAGIKLARMQQSRQLPLADTLGRAFTYALPDLVLESLDDISARGRGTVSAPELVASPVLRDRYLMNSLMEEAITSSQLEGAVTTRRVAKDLLRTNRAPRDRSERMIVNNFHAMQFVRDHVTEDLTPALVCELHRIVTKGTLDHPDAAGRLQLPHEPRVGVWAAVDDVQLHEPPPAVDLPARMVRLCDFANGVVAPGWMPPLLRAIITHFMVGYDHYFEDGNGRLARALFYWVALKDGFWLMEFVAISLILKDAPAQYAESYLHTEQDSGDVTYFVLYQLKVIRRAIDELYGYLARKAVEVRSARDRVSALDLNHRQTAIVEGALRDGGLRLTVQSHATSHDVTFATARSDLRGLQGLGLLASSYVGRAEVWRPVRDFAETLTTVNLPLVTS
ncbi:MAG TPA: cell filamentation protein Fic [Propionibacteriaceae bacterium]|nr:Fic family protein [Micropruina sp.]HBX82386.1 cell filamentation protein Fic [Propionibacteriaceae bacterium]HBY23087.1 cell filamentation protein Fic [Propionibacteriaceae bacterium]